MSTRIAIVAGAGSGLGQATALALHAAGYTIVAVDRSESGLNELPDAITHREVADATDPAVPVPLVDKIATEVGAPSVLVNTIGARKAAMSNPVPGAGRTQAASAGSAMKARDLDMTIRTVAAVLWASLRSSARVSAHWCAPAAARIRSGTCGSAPDTHAATARRSYWARAAAWK